ncbi:ATPase, partial [Candidatus Woesearchaeota archaeon]
MEKYDLEQSEKGFKERIKNYAKLIERARNEIKKVIIGQDEMINDVLRAIIAGGHVLLEGVPGLAKTLLVRTVSRVSGGKFVRIQFTPDLLPSDLIGMSVYRPQTKRFEIVKGPVFSNFVLADEINRASPKVQSALLECMQEKQVTIAGKTIPVPRPFFVLATQNPIETLGTYPLPEAQVDRFMFKVLVSYPKFNEEVIILENNIDVKKFDEFKLKRVLELSNIGAMQEDVRKIYIDPILKKYIVSLTDATRNPEKYGIKLGKYIRYGGSP